MGFDGPLEDRLAIRELMGTYADAAFRGDVEAYLACWTDDGVRAQGVSEIRGKAALRAMWDQIWAGLEKMAFFTELAGSEVRGDRATARVYCREIRS
jgi:ketosteroid isomerase-like protein